MLKQVTESEFGEVSQASLVVPSLVGDVNHHRPSGVDSRIQVAKLGRKGLFELKTAQHELVGMDLLSLEDKG
jgi:hypothetical protein